jgi:hypothetical protein
MEFNIRNNGIADVKVLDDNHFWVPPFACGRQLFS